MKVKNISAAFTTEKVEESKHFYVAFFNARVTFDSAWYVNLQFGSPEHTLQFMSPQKPEHKLGNSDGLVYNILVDDVDEEYTRLQNANLPIEVPLENHPWGDRGFAVKDPNGITLYIYSEREPDGEFRACHRKEEDNGGDANFRLRN